MKLATIGWRVEKKSGKPFKSGLKMNTVKGIIDHLILQGEKAYTFEEDDSYVSCCQCRSVAMVFSPPDSPNFVGKDTVTELFGDTSDVVSRSMEESDDDS